MPKTTTEPRSVKTTKAPKPEKDGAKKRTGDLFVAIILDKSGSMTAVKNATISSYNEFKATQAREGKKLGAKTQWALTLFDTEVVRQDAVEAQKAPDLNTKSYVPGGCTALYDAVGETLSALEADYNAGKLPEHVLIAIQTDGQENSSREWTQRTVFDLIGRLQALGFAVTFLGADQDAYITGGAMNIPRQNTISYDSHSETHSTWSMANLAASNFRTGRNVASNLYAPVANKPDEDGTTGDTD